MIERRDARRWAVVLAGGDGQRMDPFIRGWLGHSRPKQYCAFAGGRTMLEHTYDRALAAAAPERIVTIINADHRPFIESPRRLTVPGRVVEQPSRRDTGPGVYLPLSLVKAADPGALVALMPSDHFIHPIERFAALLDEAYALADDLPGQIVLLSARPDRAEPEYGWIEPGLALVGRPGALVNRFKEKPAHGEAAELYAAGGLWNTMIVVARVSALWDAAREHQPGMMARFDGLLPWIGGASEAAAIERAYDGMESVNFSRGVLERAASWSVALPMDGIRWSDWGRPARILETLEEIGHRHEFPPDLVAAGRSERRHGLRARRRQASASSAAPTRSTRTMCSRSHCVP